MKVLELNVKVEPIEKGFRINFEGGIGSKIEDILNEEEYNKAKELTAQISEIVKEAIVRDITKDLDGYVEETLEATIEDIKKIEEELDKLDTPEEQMMYIFKKLREAITKK